MEKFKNRPPLHSKSYEMEFLLIFAGFTKFLHGRTRK